jgi:hypothetical protein
MGSEQLDIVERSAPSDTKVEMSKAQPSEKNKESGGTSGPASTLTRSRSGRAALRREQWEDLESNHCETQATGKDGEADYRSRKQSPREKKKFRYACRLFGMNSLKEG